MHALAISGLIRGAAVMGLCGLALRASAQRVIPVWPGVAPGSENWRQKEVEYQDGQGKKMVRNIVQPTLTTYLPDRAKANGTAIVICPGGGFRFLSWDNEGIDVAKWLRERGVAAFVLKYRVRDTGATQEEFNRALQELFHPSGNAPSAPDPVPSLATADGRQALKLVRQRAAEWGISPSRIGIMGFSAGAYVTTGVIMNHDADSRPNFAAPIYGGSTGGAPVPADAPPLFLVVAEDDTPNAIGDVKLCGEWQAAGKPVELHLYTKGGHGFGMRKQGLPIDAWIERLGDWLQMQGLLKPAS